jgi:hypothetical protein
VLGSLKFEGLVYTLSNDLPQMFLDQSKVLSKRRLFNCELYWCNVITASFVLVRYIVVAKNDAVLLMTMATTMCLF